MIGGLFVAGCACALGRHRLEIAAWALAAVVPSVGLVAVALAVFVSARLAAGTGDRSPASRLMWLASEMKAGRTLRAALAASPESELGEMRRRARAGRPMNEVLDAYVPHLGRVAPVARAALAVAAATGGAVSAALETLAEQAVAIEELARERRAALMPAVIQAAVVGGLPTVMLGWFAASGRLARELSAGSLEAAVVGIGLAMTVSGIATVVWLAARSTR